MSIEGVRFGLAREGRRQIDDLVRRLKRNAETGELEAFLVPGHGGEDFQTALSYLQWVLGQLHDRGVAVRAQYRKLTAGLVFGLEIEPAEEAECP